jgi:hypothetical protein
MGDADPDADRAAQAFLAHSQTVHTQEYVARGRRHQSLSAEELAARWCDVMRRWAADAAKPEARSDMSDVQSEYALRGKEPPWDLVKDEMDQVAEATREWLEDIRTIEPERWAQMSRELEADIATFMKRGQN